MTHRLTVRMSAMGRSAFPCRARIMIGGPDRLGDECAESAVRPGGRTERMVVPEHGSHVRIDPEPLPDESTVMMSFAGWSFFRPFARTIVLP